MADRVEDDISFSVAVRGYDRRQVDDHLARRRRVERELRAAVAEAERALREATAELARLREEPATRRSADGAGGFGARAEKLLRLAESEAAEVRAGASREAVAIVERARVAAEQHRHESEQAVIARSRELEEQGRRRAAELTDREEKVAEQAAAGRAEAERVRAAAEEAAAVVRAEARAAAEEVTAAARAEATRTREEARLDRERAAELRGQVHAELERIRRMITEQLGAEGGAAAGG